MSAHDHVIAALQAHGSRGGGRDWTCPAHDDHRASLRVTRAADRVLVKCFAGCSAEEITSALGLTLSDLFDQPPARDEHHVEATYRYVDEHGKALFEVVRFAPKRFLQRRPDGVWSLNGVRRVLYRLPEVVEAVREGRSVYVVEGERDVHAVEAAGGVATTNPGGAGKWREEFAAVLAGADVILVADQDEPGRKHARQIRDSLLAHGASVRLVEAAAGKDATDHLAAGHGLEDFVQVTEEPRDRPSGLRLARMSGVRARRVDWLIHEAVPIGNTTLVAGPAGLAKTTLLCDWAGRISRGQMPGVFRGRPRDVVLMTGEDSIASTLKPRCEAAGADPSRVHFVEFGDEEFAIPGDLDRMAATLATVPEAVFFGIDPLMAFVEDRIDSHKDHHIRRAFSALKRFAEEAGLAVVVIAHLNKSESRDFLSRVAGSVGIGAAVRSGFAVVERPDTDPDERERLLVHVKANLGPYQPTQRFRVEARTALTHEGEPLSTSGLAWLGVDESVTRANVLADPEERTERDEAADWLRDFLGDGPREAEEVLKAARSAGFAEKTLRRAKADLRVESRPGRSADGRRLSGWTWSLPSLDGQHKGLSRGHLENPRETAGQGAPQPGQRGLDGHSGDPGHVEDESATQDLLDQLVEAFGGRYSDALIAYKDATGTVPVRMLDMLAAPVRDLIARSSP